MEVDCPALSLCASVDAHIDLMPVQVHENITGYLHSSPEYGMKKLLSQGIGDIYQLSHVFRQGEKGALHNPEFTMVEWYRLGVSFEQMIEETLSFMHLFLGKKSTQTLTYREAFLTYAGIDYVKAKEEELSALLSMNTPMKTEGWDRDTLLQAVMSFVIEPQFPQEKLVVLRDFPASQSALSQTSLKGEEQIAERFEVYYNGIELANGYHELTDAEEQRKRLHASNAHRLKLGKKTLPIDEEFLEALERGIPDCCGVAVGFDRLMLLRHNLNNLADCII